MYLTMIAYTVTAVYRSSIKAKIGTSKLLMSPGDFLKIYAT